MLILLLELLCAPGEFLSLSLPLIPYNNLLPLLNTHESLFFCPHLFPLQFVCEKRTRKAREKEQRRERKPAFQAKQRQQRQVTWRAQRRESCRAQTLFLSLLSSPALPSLKADSRIYRHCSCSKLHFSLFLSPAQPCRWVTGGSGKRENEQESERKTSVRTDDHNSTTTKTNTAASNWPIHTLKRDYKLHHVVKMRERKVEAMSERENAEQGARQNWN